MFIPYIDETTLCNKLAQYRIGDTVITLSNIKHKDGIIEAGTKLIITNIRLNPKIPIPRILVNSIDEYEATQDEWTFVYDTKVLSKKIENIFELTSNMFENKDIPVEKPDKHLRAKTNKKKQASAKYWLKGICILLCFYIILGTLLSPLAYLFFRFMTNDPPVPGVITTSITTATFAALFFALSSQYGKLITNHCITRKRNRMEKQC